MLAASVFCAFLAVATAAPLLDVPVPLPTLDPIFPGPESTVASRSSSTASSSSVSSTPSTSTATTSTPLPTTYPSPSPVAAYPSPEPVTGNSTGIHDPSMVKTPEGTYLVYGSGNWHSDTGVDVGLAIPTWSSPDRVVSTAFRLTSPDSDSQPSSYALKALRVWIGDFLVVADGRLLIFVAHLPGLDLSRGCLRASST